MDNWKLQHHVACECQHCISHPSQAPPGIHVFPDKLHVVTVIFNPLRWRARLWHYWAFERECEAAGAILYTVEVAFGDRHFEITQPNNPRHIQLRTTSEIWLKENALNIGISRLPVDAKYIAWIDADVKFQRPDWAQETLQQLQHYDLVQMFSFAQNTNSNYEPLGQPVMGFVRKWLTEAPLPSDQDFFDKRELVSRPAPYPYYSGGAPGVFGHPGFAWAACRDYLNKVGMLIDWAILGSGDYHMATALVGHVDRSLYGKYSPAYIRRCHEWQNRCEKYIMHNIGYVPGTAYHSFHGSTKNRNYDNRWKFLWMAGYDPELDIKRDWQGLYQLTDRSTALRDGIRAYNRLRSEDEPYNSTDPMKATAF